MRIKPKTTSARQLERERFGLDYDPVSTFSPKKISDNVSSVINNSGLKDKLWEHDLIDNWMNIVGKDVANHTRPGSLNDGKLTVYVDSSPWLCVLEREYKSAILKNIKIYIDNAKVSDIVFAIDPKC